MNIRIAKVHRSMQPKTHVDVTRTDEGLANSRSEVQFDTQPTLFLDHLFKYCNYQHVHFADS